MFFCLRKLTLNSCGRRGTLGRWAVVMAGLIAVSAFTACGGGQSAMNQSSTSTQITPAALSVAATLPAGTQGSVYNGSVTASGGTAPYSYAVVSGQLPQGVNLDSSKGDISGTPGSAGNFSFTVAASDAKGNSKQSALQISVQQAAATSTPAPTPAPPSNPPPTTPPPASPAPANNGHSLSNLQASGGWGEYGQGPPNFVDCSPSPCNGISFSMTQGVQSPSQSGNATVFWLGGTAPYSDALWNNHLIGMYSTQGLPDTNQTLVPSIYNFTYDVDFYGDNLDVSEALEFDINQFFGGMGFIFGHECRVADGNQWDIWDNSKGQWIPTGIPCNPKSGQWNHLTLKVQRTSDNHESYQSITLNGQTANLNWTFNNGPSPNWYGVTVNFQADGNYKQDAYKVYLDNLTLTYE